MSTEDEATHLVDTEVSAGAFKSRARSLSSRPPKKPFAKLPAGTVEQPLKDPTLQLSQIPTHHVVPGEVLASTVMTLDGRTVKTAQSAEISIVATGDNGAVVAATGQQVHVVTADVVA